MMVGHVKTAPPERQLALLRAHPDLGTRARISEASAAEQTGAAVISGFELLVHQAARQVELMTARTAPVAAMRRGGQAELRRRAEGGAATAGAATAGAATGGAATGGAATGEAAKGEAATGGSAPG